MLRNRQLPERGKQLNINSLRHASGLDKSDKLCLDRQWAEKKKRERRKLSKFYIFILGFPLDQGFMNLSQNSWQMKETVWPTFFEERSMASFLQSNGI